MLGIKKKLCMNIACICDFTNVTYCYLSLLLPAPVSTLQALHTWTFCPGLRFCRYSKMFVLDWMKSYCFLLIVFVERHFARFRLFSFLGFPVLADKVLLS